MSDFYLIASEINDKINEKYAEENKKNQKSYFTGKDKPR